MLGDGISHAVLPGIAIGYIISQSRESVWLLLGAIIMGIITAVLTEYIAENRKIDEGASLGVVFSGLFALGLLLIASVSSKVDLDPSCVLFGAVELTPLDTISLWDYEIPRAVILNGTVMLVNIIAIVMMYRKLNASVFDPQFARTIGINTKLIRYIHIILVSITTVIAFESVGSILIISLLVVPQVIALLLSHRIKYVFIISVLVSIFANISGHIMAITIPPLMGMKDTNTVGSVSVALALLLFIVLIASPKGMLAKKVFLFLHQVDIAREDILKLLYKSNVEQLSVSNIKALVAPSMLAGRINTWALLCAKQYVFYKKEVEHKNGEFICTEAGIAQATRLTSRHRKWEDYLFTQVDIQPEQVHFYAEQMEHVRNRGVLSRLEDEASDRADIPGHDHKGK